MISFTNKNARFIIEETTKAVLVVVMLLKERPNTYNNKHLDLRNDYVFKAFFGDSRNKKLLIHFLNSVLDETIHSIELTDPHIEGNHPEDKIPILDVRIQTENGEQINIEMQMKSHKAFTERMYMYMAKMYVSQDKEGKSYVDYRKSTQIIIVNFNLLREDNFHNTYKITNQESGSIFTEHYEMHVLELPKFDTKQIVNTTELEKWLLFLKGNQQTKEELAMESRAMKEAYEEIERLSQDPKTRRLAEFRERELKDIQQGKLDAWEDGQEQGIERAKRETVIRMYGKDFSLADISFATNLSTEKINEIIRTMAQ